MTVVSSFNGPHNATEIVARGTLRDFDRLCELIARGDADEAIALVGDLAGRKFPSVATLKNLFPERIP